MDETKGILTSYPVTVKIITKKHLIFYIFHSKRLPLILEVRHGFQGETISMFKVIAPVRIGLHGGDGGETCYANVILATSAAGKQAGKGIQCLMLDF